MNMAAILDVGTLGALPLFRDLTPEQLAQLAQLLRRTTFPPKTNLINVEQPGEVVYNILTGTVKIYVEQADGSEVIIAFGGPGDIEGEMSVLDDLSRSANVVTQEATTVLWMDRAAFQECLQTIPTMSYNLNRILASRLRMANARIQALCSLDVYGRVARQILTFAQQYGQATSSGPILIPLRLTQSDLASFVGASRERVNQVMALFKEHSYISVDRHHHITVHDPAALIKYFH